MSSVYSHYPSNSRYAVTVFSKIIALLLFEDSSFLQGLSLTFALNKVVNSLGLSVFDKRQDSITGPS